MEWSVIEQKGYRELCTAVVTPSQRKEQREIKALGGVIRG